MLMMQNLLAIAPCGEITSYDLHQLALYAALLDADAVGTDWREAAATVMRLDPDHEWTEHCWQSHLERARWITGRGLAQAVEVFGRTPI